MIIFSFLSTSTTTVWFIHFRPEELTKSTTVCCIFFLSLNFFFVFNFSVFFLFYFISFHFNRRFKNIFFSIFFLLLFFSFILNCYFSTCYGVSGCKLENWVAQQTHLQHNRRRRMKKD